MNWLTRSLGSLLLGCTVWALPIAAFAEYPDKPIRLIVPQAAGSATDTVARILAAELGPQLGGVTIVVEDKPGAAFTIGLDLVAKAAPDGYTRRHRADRRARHQPQHGAEAALCHREGPPADRADRARPSDARGVAEVRHQVGEGIDRQGQGQSGQAHQRVVGQRFAGPRRRRIVQVHDRHADPARAVPRRRGRDERPDRGSCRSDVRKPQLDFADGEVGRGARPRRQRRQALDGIPRYPDHRGGGRAGLQRADLDRR